MTERIWLNWFMNGIELMFQELVPCDWHLPSDVPSPCFDWREPPLKVVDWWSFNHCSRVGDRRKRGDCAKVQSSRHLRILLSQCGINDCQCPNHHSITLWLTCWVSFAVCDMRMSIKCVLINFTVLWFQETSWCPILYISPISDLCFWYKY